MALRNIKCVCIGDGAVGKTCLLMSYAQEKFPTEYLPTIFDNYIVNQNVEGIGHVSLNLWDTAGQGDYDKLRELSYPESEVILICFSINSATSLANIRYKWALEAQEHCPRVPIILLGLQCDRRLDAGTENLLLESDGYKLQREIKACKYIECSALLNTNVKEVFQEAIKVAVQGVPEEERSCCVLL